MFLCLWELLDVFQHGCPSLRKLGTCKDWNGVQELLQDTFCRSSRLRSCLICHLLCVFLCCFSRWELLKTTVTSETLMRLSLTCVTRMWWRTHLITVSFLLEKRKEQTVSNDLFQHEILSDPLEAPLWVSITSSTPLSSPVDSYVDGRLWKRRSFIMFSKFLLSQNTVGWKLICCCELVMWLLPSRPSCTGREMTALLPVCSSCEHLL